MVKKICNICKKKIIEKKEAYTNIIDYKFGEEVKNFWYHSKCFNDRIHKINPAHKEYYETLGMAKSILKRFGGKQIVDFNKIEDGR